MKMTIGHLATLLATAVERGHGDIEVTINLNTSAPLFSEAEPVSIKNCPVERDATGRWKHPATPANWDVPMGTWLRQRGFDFCVNYLIKPDDYTKEDISKCQPVYPIHRGRAGRWICWEINTNADGEPIAVWIAPIEKLETV